jgi:hypothetical protein
MSRTDSELRARILNSVAEQPTQTRSQARARAGLLYLLSAVAMGAMFFAAGGFAHANGRPASISLWILAGEALVSVLVTWVVLGAGRSMTGRPSGVLAVATVAVPAIVFSWLTWWHGSYVEPFRREGWMCMALTLGMAAVLLTAILLARQRSVPTHPLWVGAGVGAVSGAWADLVVDAWCPLTNAPHVLRGHVAPILALVLAGSLLGHRLLSVRAR